MRDFAKHLYYDTTLGHRLISPIKWLYEFYCFQIIPEKLFIKSKYKKKLKHNLNLDNPHKFTEKIQWLKINDRKPLHTICADKYAVKDYIKEKIGEQYLIPLVFQTEDPSDIKPENFPDFPCIIKTNHNSGGSVIVKDKLTVDWKNIQKSFAKQLKINYYTRKKEWEYKNIKPRIIVEKLLIDKSGNDILNDYKIHCFNGKPLYIQTIFDRLTEVKEDWYDIEWNLQEVYYYSPIKKHVAKPKLLNEMLVLAEKLSKEFIYVRVDLYIVNDNIFFGELTFRPLSGYMRFIPESFDNILGEKLKIPIAHH